MNWQEFGAAAPELATLGKERFERTGLVLVGTLRKNGWPRISPVEPFIVEGELMLGMMWRSRKALDLLRDPRVAVHSATCHREGSEGDFKLYGRGVDVTNPRMRAQYEDAVEAKIDWRPAEPYHLFAVKIESAAFVVFGQKRFGMRWNPTQGTERWTIPAVSEHA
jgi:hypothetical protein